MPIDGLVERNVSEEQRGCPDCGAVVACRVADVGYHYSMRGYQFAKGPEHARTCRNWQARNLLRPAYDGTGIDPDE